MTGHLLEARIASRFFPVASGSGWFGRGRQLRAVDAVSLAIQPGETLALVGESGSGKSTLGRLLLGLLKPSRGAILYRGVDLATVKGAAWRDFRRDVQVVFQDTSMSFNPRRTVGQSVELPLRYNLRQTTGAARDAADALLEQVGLPPATFRDRLPHELSGGQRQRVGIARALASQPSLIIADEPVSALDVSVRAHILRLMQELQQTRQLSYLFITHDLGAVRAVADRVAVMYLGAIVEEGPVDQVLAAPRHPYTHALLDASPMPDPALGGERRKRLLRGDPPSPIDMPPGCRFSTRCPYAQPACTQVEPAFVRDNQGTGFACHFPL